MRIKQELIPKDKLKEISIKQIYEIIYYLFEPLKVDVESIEIPKFLPSFDFEELSNRTFEGKLISIKDGKALFEPKQGENEKILYFDEVLEVQDLLFELKHKQEEAQKVEKRKIRKEVFILFDKIFLSNGIKKPQPIKTRADYFKENLEKGGFYNLEKIKRLSEEGRNRLIEVLSNGKMPYGIAMFDYLGFCKFLDAKNGVKYKTNKYLSRLYNQNAKDGTTAKHHRNSLVNNKSRYTSYLHIETVIKDYEELK